MYDTPMFNQPGRRRGRLKRLLLIPARSLMPILAILIIAGTLLWGPWVSLTLAVALHFIVERAL